MSNKRINYSPFVHSQWVEFNGYRFKNPHMVRLKDGTESPMFPNGGAWSGDGHEWIDDSEVTHIMALPDYYPNLGRQMPGGWRISRDILHRGTKFPVWCGPEYGFIYEDQLPEGKEILPVQIQAHRFKGDNTRITLFVTQGLVVDISPYNPKLEDFKKYTEVPGFWYDPDIEVLSNDELVHSIHWAYDYLRLKEQDPETVAELEKYLREVVGQKPNKYLPLFGFALKQWKTNKDEFCRQMETYEAHTAKLKSISKNTLTNAARIRMLNDLRGPKPDMTFDINMLKVSNFLKNPKVLPEVADTLEMFNGGSKEKA